MDFIITNDQLKEWCRYKADEIKNMSPEQLNVELRPRADVAQFYKEVGDMMADEVIENNRAGKITKWICPAGPLDQYDYFIERVHRERISLKNLWIFMMDEFLDWESRPLPTDVRYGSLRGTMERRVFSKIDPELMCPREQIIFPDPQNLDYYDNKIEEMGGIDTCWAGIGAKGLVAFCEAPHSRYYRISQEQFKNSKTRIVELNEDTLVALSQRSLGAYYDMIPPKAVTLGMKAILSSKRIVYMLRGGSWKQTVLRIMLFCKETTLEYPVTFTTKYIPEKILFCDEETLEHPLSNWADTDIFWF